MIHAWVICDSVSPQGYRLTTFLLRYPKFVHGELMTHRAFSRNASSSRAVPVSKNIEEVRSDELRAAPVFWGAEQKGMSPGGELSDTVEERWGNCSQKEVAQYHWQMAALNAVDQAEGLALAGAHKSIVNRVLEPFLHINTLVTATEYMNFFGLRLDGGADPTMRALAEAMWHEYSLSTAMLLKPGDYHLPFVDFVRSPNYPTDPVSGDYMDAGVTLSQQTAIKVSVARCARLSYASFETGRRSTIEEDLKLYDRLVGAQPMHASPAEHQATPDEFISDINDAKRHGKSWEAIGTWANAHDHGNFVGWRQFRQFLAGQSCAPMPSGYEAKK